MKPGWILSLLLLLTAVGARGATVPLYINNSVTNNPQIDATALLNGGVLTAGSSITTFGFAGSSVSPFETQNTLFYTNSFSALMSGSPGFRFEFITNAFRYPSAQFVNQGTIRAAGGFASSIVGGGFIILGSATSGGSVIINASNIVNPGLIDVSGGLIRLVGKTIDIQRGGLQASITNTLTTSGFVFNTNQYINDFGVSDIYWGAGAGQVMRTNSRPQPIFLPANTFTLPTPRSPFHEVAFSSAFGSFPSFAQIPSVFGTPFSAYVYTGGFGTNLFFNVVFVATNSTETNLTANVRFFDQFTEAVPTVEFAMSDVDVVSGTVISNTVYILDRLSTQTNSTLFRNVVDPTFRPGAYEITRGAPFEWSFGTVSNAPFANNMFFQPGFVNTTVTNLYAAYEANIANLGSAFNTSGNTALSDPTNSIGRIELNADNLNMFRTRMRAENLITIRSTNIISLAGSAIDAPIFKYNVANTNTTLQLTNFMPGAVRRLHGTVAAYSAFWTNFVASGGVTNQVTFHVTMVDASGLQSIVPVTAPELTVTGTNVVINNVLNPSQTFTLNTASLTFSASNQLFLNFGTLLDLTSSNLLNVNYFTNDGLVSVIGEARVGSDRSAPMSNVVNRGTFTGSAQTFKSLEFDNSGSVSALSGPVSVTARSVRLGGAFSAAGAMTVSGDNIKVRNHTNISGSTLTLTVTNSMTDNGADASNSFSFAFGMVLPVKPAFGDLLGSTFTSAIPPNAFVSHIWAGENLGPDRVGYTNNAAIGKLVLNPANANGFFQFTGTGTNNALYVDQLVLAGAAQTNYLDMIGMDTNMTVYFSSANVPVDTLDGQFGGRLRWVRNFAGLNSTVDVILADGRTISVNLDLVNSTSIDTDADGIVNAFDLSPFDGVFLRSSVTFTNVPPLTAQIQWEASAGLVYRIEYSSSLGSNNWLFLSNFTNSATLNGVVTFRDPLPAGTGTRFYRVTYSP